jgi:hypothetical protein
MIAEEINVYKDGEKNFNKESEHEKYVCPNGPKKSTSFQPENTYQHLNTLCSHQLFPSVIFLFSHN